MNIEIELTDVPDDACALAVHIDLQRVHDGAGYRNGHVDGYTKGYEAALAEHHPHRDAGERKYVDARDELETENPVRAHEHHDDQHGGKLDAALREGNTGPEPGAEPREADPMPDDEGSVFEPNPVKTREDAERLITRPSRHGGIVQPPFDEPEYPYPAAPDQYTDTRDAGERD